MVPQYAGKAVRPLRSGVGPAPGFEGVHEGAHGRLGVREGKTLPIRRLAENLFAMVVATAWRSLYCRRNPLRGESGKANART